MVDSLPPNSTQRVPSLIELADPATNVAYKLGFDDSTSPPTTVWVPVGTWSAAKALWSSWGAAKAACPSWAVAKAILS